jgi:carboxylesterase
MSDRFPIIPGAEPWSAPGSGARAATGIVVIHGFTGNPTSTRAFGEALAKSGFAVEVVRLPGHGTHWRDMAKTVYGDWRWEVERALDGLRSARKRVVLAGLSMGGTIALDIACARPDAAAGVVAINATVLDREGFIAKAAPFLEKILPVVPAGAAGLAKNDIAKGGDEHAYELVPARAGNSFLKELARIRRGLTALAVPALIAHSPNDHSVPPDNSIAILKMLSGKDVEDLVLERSHHLATMDYDLDLLIERVEKFAERVGKAS